MSDHRWPSPHHNSVPEFQLSGIPYTNTFKMTDNLASADYLGDYGRIEINFDSVTRWIQILNHDDTCNNHVHLFFSYQESEWFLTAKNGGGAFIAPDLFSPTKGCKHIRIDKTSTSIRYELKCKSIWVVAHKDVIFSVIAGLTNISSSTFPDQTRVNGFAGVESAP